MNVARKEFVKSAWQILLAFMVLYVISFSCGRACQQDEHNEQIRKANEEDRRILEKARF